MSLTKAYVLAFLAAFGVLTLQDALPQWWGVMVGKVALSFIVFACVLGKGARHG